MSETKDATMEVSKRSELRLEIARGESALKTGDLVEYTADTKRLKERYRL